MTKEEIKALIATITKENTTEQAHADALNAIVDAMEVGSGRIIFDTDAVFETGDEGSVSVEIVDRLYEMTSAIENCPGISFRRPTNNGMEMVDIIAINRYGNNLSLFFYSIGEAELIAWNWHR